MVSVVKLVFGDGEVEFRRTTMTAMMMMMMDPGAMMIDQVYEHE